MYHVHRIASLDLPELAPYRTLKLPHEHRNAASSWPKATRSCIACSPVRWKLFPCWCRNIG
jgi:hypothetical protein